MELKDKIIQIYPSVTKDDFETIIVLQDDRDGKGAYIKEWNHPTLPKPTDEQLA